jgi:uncharacterized protein
VPTTSEHNGSVTNRLAAETSPYLRQHAENPVDWYPWGPEAFELARAEDRPVLLSVGYSSCHWCHVMAHESFEDEATAATMNDHFVNIKVDREERPDVDAIYMEATQAMTGHGGWPMTVFMTAAGEPFFCGTYFPADASRGQPTFPQLLAAIDDAWRNRRPELLEQASRLVASIGRNPSAPPGTPLPGSEVLDEATLAMLAAHDAQWGGFGAAPKFPQAMSLGHLLRHHRRRPSPTTLAAVTTSLDAMASGGIYDQVGGGFSRYSVDAHWLVPHFEKMLYDNALIARTYLWAWQSTGEDRYLQVLDETIAYVLRDLSHPDGGRYSAEDADSLATADAAHAEEGAFYVWTPDQVATALADAGLGDLLDTTLSWYGITEGGNFEGASIPNRMHVRGELRRPPEIESARQALLEARATRPRPGLDDKVLTEWNALMLATLADAAAATGRRDWLEAAEATATFLCERLRRPADDRHPSPRWLRSWQADLDGGAGGARHLAYASDHAALVDGFLSLYEATGVRRWLDEAVWTADALIELFWDLDGGVWSTGDDAEELVSRPKDLMDNATPSANSMTAVGLLRLEAHTGESRYGEHARTILRTLGGVAGNHALSFANLLWAIELHTEGVTEVVVTGDRPDLVEVAQRRFRPDTVLAWGEPGDGPLWEGRGETGADGRAYACRDHACGAPATSPQELDRQLG